MTIIWYMVPEISTASDRFFLSSWTICCPFTPLTARKMKISEKWKKHLEISSFYTIAPKLMIIGYTVREIWVRDGCNCIFHCVHFLHFYPPNSPKNKNFKKKKKITWRCHHFTQVCQKYWLYAVLFLRYGTWHM